MFWKKKEKTFLETHCDELVEKIWQAAQQKPMEWRTWGRYNDDHCLTSLALEVSGTLLRITKDGEILYEARKNPNQPEIREFVCETVALNSEQRAKVSEAFSYILAEKLQRVLQDLLNNG